MSEERTKYLESIIRKWFNNGARCNPSLKPYKRSLFPTYNPNRRINRNRKSRHRRRSTNKSMRELCEEFLRKNRHLLKI